MVVNQQPEDHHYYSLILSDRYQTECTTKVDEACQRLAEEAFSFVLLDISSCSPAECRQQVGLLCARLRRANLVCTGPAEATELVIAAVKSGASHYLSTPVQPAGLLSSLLQLSSQAVGEDTPSYAAPPASSTVVISHQATESTLHGSSQAMRQVRETIALYAQDDASVLIVGDTGTGKELAAKAIHRLSPRQHSPFVPVDCASLPETLAESILFGAEKGAYTDAFQRKGIFEEADSGTVFLDELAELPLCVQAKLLRTVETRRCSRLGSHRQIEFDIRLVSATNARHLQDERLFRPDLLSRLDTLVLELPPLRAHPEDIPELTTHFMNLKRVIKPLASLALEKLQSWHWPCNVRELKNVITRACVLARNKEIIGIDDIQISQLQRWTGYQRTLLG
ncbi:MAG: hypothetical protein A2004_03510 [Spirochaetes bacterium GWC1_61_12]|nr:MAG: hypothetical protein A2004_03510 [Spirochaetes bacterium GWC1_61_12]OHD59984.1 MAG: hypothetical protein A2Y32_14510 [Spirochaetes bacterium GWF1_60_12]